MVKAGEGERCGVSVLFCRTALTFKNIYQVYRHSFIRSFIKIENKIGLARQACLRP